MFSLVITIIAIALVAALALATLYYGGSAFNQGSARAEAAKIMTQAQQVLAAADLYHVDMGIWPASMADLTVGEYLTDVPVASLMMLSPALAQTAPWGMPMASHPVFTVPQTSIEVCQAINQMSMGINGIPRATVATWNAHCFGANTSALTAVISKELAELAIVVNPVISPPVGCGSPDWLTQPSTCDGGGPPSSGGSPGLSVTPAAVNFADTLIGEVSYLIAAVAVTNTGNASVDLIDFTVSGSLDYFTDMGTCGATLAVGTGCTLGVQFWPATPGSSMAVATLQTSLGPNQVFLLGTGLNALPGGSEPDWSGSISMSYTFVQFPSTFVGEWSIPVQPLVLTNTGDAPVTFSGSPANSTADYYVGAGTCPSTLPVGASCSPSLTFAPGFAGTLTDAITWATSHGNVYVSLSGIATDRPVPPPDLPIQVTYNGQIAGRVIYQTPATFVMGYDQGTLNLGPFTPDVTGSLGAYGQGYSPEYTLVVTNLSEHILMYGGPGMSPPLVDDCSSAYLQVGASCNVRFRLP